MRAETWRDFDFWLMGAVAVLVIFGIAMIDSAIAGNIELLEANAVQRQMVFAGIGLAVVIIATSIDYHIWATIGRLMYGGVAALLVGLYFLGAAFFGAQRWLETALFNIQPSELAKYAMILVLADFFARNQHRMGELSTILRSLGLTMGLVVWVILQPDLSTSIVILVIWAALLWGSGIEIKRVLVFGGIGLLILAVSLPLMIATEVIEDYQIERITDFLIQDPNDPDARYGSIYNVNQSLISIGSGGLTGKGYGQGSQVQLRFLKVRWSDFLFAAMAEEFGFVGTILVMILLVFVILRVLRAARLARDTYGTLVCYGVATVLTFQASVNIGMNLQLLPVTGLPLPFMSYGGSSLLTMMLGIGLVQSVVSRHRMRV